MFHRLMIIEAERITLYTTTLRTPCPENTKASASLVFSGTITLNRKGREGLANGEWLYNYAYP